jgi:hypothetical protein
LAVLGIEEIDLDRRRMSLSYPINRPAEENSAEKKNDQSSHHFPFRYILKCDLQKNLALSLKPYDFNRVLSDQIRPWDFKFTGNISLTEATGRRRVLEPVF